MPTALWERVQIDQEKSKLDEVKKVFAGFEPFFLNLDPRSQLEVVRRFHSYPLAILGNRLYGRAF